MSSTTVQEILDAIQLELDVTVSSPKMEEQLMWWLNAVYTTVVDSDEYSWRKQDIPLTLYGPTGTVSVQFTYSSTTAYLTGWTGDMPGIEHGIVTSDSFDHLYGLCGQQIVAITPRRYQLTLESNFIGTAATYTDCNIYRPRYPLSGVQDDWITGVYLQGQDTPLPRVYPREGVTAFQYYKKHTGQPEAFYTEGRTTAGDALLCFIPSPDKAYEVTVKTMLGAAALTSTTQTTILPSGHDKLLLVYGVAMLYCISHKDVEGASFYKDRFYTFLSKLQQKNKVEPGREARLVGHLTRRVGWDPDLPIDWNF